MQAQPSRLHISDYDGDFQRSAGKFLLGKLPDDDWRWFKAQCYQESRLQPDVISPAGAAGICQLMPGAAADAGITPSDRFDPRSNIRAGAWILRRGIQTWWPRPTRFDRLQLGLACYNAGCGHIIKAQLLCGGARLWEDISPCLERVTGIHSRETIHYVKVIPKWYNYLRDEQ